MSSKLEKEKQKQIQDRCQRLLTQMLKDEDNKYCVDCDAKGPRWASWNIGVFLCIRCAGIHRNLGVHISRVKSVNLDTWTPQQVVSLQQMGNSRARAVYEANLPDNFRRPQTDSSLEAFIRSKYERKKYIAQEWVQPPLPKVNWDKELEEEAEKMKKKKKEAKQTSVTTSVRSLSTPPVIPQPLPKPQTITSSPKSTRSVVQQSTVDLLGMDTPTKEFPTAKKTTTDSDLFAHFLETTEVTSVTHSTSSGGTTTPANSNSSSSSTTTSNRTAEEESFFNQSTVATPSKQKQLTKDSILALYGTPNAYTGTNTMSQSFNAQQLNGLMPNYSPGQINVPTNMQNGTASQNNTQFSAGISNIIAAPNPFYSRPISQPYSPFSAQKLNHQMSAMNLNPTNSHFSQTGAIGGNQQNATSSTDQFFGQNAFLPNAQQPSNLFNHVLTATPQWQ